jgi:hypothetical protein
MTISQPFWCVIKTQNPKESLLFHFLVHEYTFKGIFSPKNFRKKICLGQDPDPVLDNYPDPDVLKSRIRIRIRSKIVRVRNTAIQYNRGGARARAAKSESALRLGRKHFFDLSRK